VRTLVDADRAGSDIEELLRHIDVVVLPGSAALALGRSSGLGGSLASIGRETGAAAVVATLGGDGALVWCREREIHVPAWPVGGVDTTGAGDAFRGGFAASWLASAGSDPDVEVLVADANLVAGLNCRSVGAQAGLPRPVDVPARLWGPV
jgi:sugar/nucleoside kinase (ribokinase family)